MGQELKIEVKEEKKIENGKVEEQGGREEDRKGSRNGSE